MNNSTLKNTAATQTYTYKPKNQSQPRSRLQQPGGRGVPPGAGRRRQRPGQGRPHTPAQRLELRAPRHRGPPHQVQHRRQRDGQVGLHAPARGRPEGPNSALRSAAGARRRSVPEEPGGPEPGRLG